MEGSLMQANAPYPLNRNLFIADNLSLLRRLDNQTIDLVCIDPPFAKNQTFIGSLRPPLTDDERRRELETLAAWGIGSECEAVDAGIDWPDAEDAAKFKDIWRWENDVHEEWIDRIDDDYPALAKVIDAARYTHSEAIAAYLTYMATRLIEIHRVLKPSGSLYLNCDHNANAYLRLALDAVFGAQNFRNDLVWSYRTGGVSRRYWPRKHDTIMFYVKSAAYRHNPVQERVYYDKPFFTSATDEQGRSYADVFVRDVWEDIKPLINTSGERTGYPTQKPVALAERIILASTNPGDVVLDCFAGCAYVPVAAERNGRQWIACDISPRALTILRRQFAKFRYSVDGGQSADAPALITDADVITRAPFDLPERADEDPSTPPAVKELPRRQFKVPASVIPEKDMLEFLLDLSGYTAWCCGFANRRADGSIMRTTNNFHLDHIAPKSKDGSNQITNRAPLCPTHNIRKSNRQISLDEYRQEIADAGEMLVDTTADLVNLAEAYQKALDRYAQEIIRRETQSVR